MLVLSRKVGERIVVPHCELAAPSSRWKAKPSGWASPPRRTLPSTGKKSGSNSASKPKARLRKGKGTREGTGITARAILAARRDRRALPSTLGNGRIARNSTPERHLMSDNPGAVCNRDALRLTFAAELTLVAYRVALRHGAGSTWVDLELDLWRALTETVKKWEREFPPLA